MRKVFVASDNIISSLGFTTQENVEALKAGVTGIRLHESDRIAPEPFWSSLVDEQQLNRNFAQFADPQHFTKFEQLAISSIREALTHSNINITGDRTLLILSTTKGNVDLLDSRTPGSKDPERVYLWKTAQILQQFFSLAHTPLVVSNACISGVLAVIVGARMIRSDRYDHIVVCGADLVTEFVLSGFNSFLSLCAGPCKPFDKERQGLSLGEAAGTIILTADKSLATIKEICVGDGYSSNDANHISGPSRTGEGLTIAIKRTLEHSKGKIDYVSAHGTATPYNDEMESIALGRVQLDAVPVNSLKGYWGHTLGAAGVIEIIAGVFSLQNDFLFKTLGFSESGVSQPLNIISENYHTAVHTLLKIASGFGGSNAALILSK